MTKQLTIKLNQKKQKDLTNFANGKWSKSEHEKFLKGFFEYGKNWTEIQRLVRTRNLSQIRSHAQKYFVKVKQEEDESCQMSIYSDSEDLLGESRKFLSYEKKKSLKKRQSGKQMVVELCEKQVKQVSQKQPKQGLLDIFKQAIQQQFLQAEHVTQTHVNQQNESQCQKAGEKICQQIVRADNEKRLSFFENLYGKWKNFC